MKTYIIQLEAHDDLVSVRDKLAWAKARRVILIWPKKGKVLGEYAPLALLKREADRQGISISFITKDGQVRENAHVLGIPIFNSVSEAERKAWKGSHQKTIERPALIGYDQLVEQRDVLHPSPATNAGMQAGRVFAIILSLLAIFSLGAFFYPSALVKFYPQREAQSVIFSLQVDPSISEINLSGIIPGRLTEVELSGARTGESTGTLDVGSTKARGNLSVENHSGASVVIPEGTKFTVKSNEELVFISLKEATLPADGNGPVQVPIEAEQAGDAGNVAAGSGFTVDGGWAKDVSITNSAAFSGGTSIASLTPSEADYEALRKLLISELKAQAAATTSKQLPAGELVIEQSLEDFKLESETRSIDPGTPSDQFSLEVKILFTVTTYSQSNLVSLANSILDANLKTGLAAVDGSLTLKNSPEVTELPSGVYGWEVDAARQVGPRVSSDSITQSLVGVPAGDIQKIMAQHVSLRLPSEVAIHPSWWTRMPFVSFRITLEEQ